MNSFKDELKAIKARLENNSALSQFCVDNLGKGLTVTTAFYRRQEIDITKLPIAMITRPDVSREIKGNRISEEHKVRIYAGFQLKTQDISGELLIQFEELILKALMTKTDHQDDIGLAIKPSNSANDEGMYHPSYFFVLEAMVIK